MTNHCPCGTGRRYSDCCGPLHEGLKYATTAEELMRSRYSAFVFKNAVYLRQTWHPDKRPTAISFRDHQKWSGLTVEYCEAGGPLDSTGVVSFVARYELKGMPGQTAEVSTFTRINHKWVYVDALKAEVSDADDRPS